MGELTAAGFVTVLIVILTNQVKSLKLIDKVPTQLVAIVCGPLLLLLYEWSVGDGADKSIIVNGIFLALSAIGTWHVGTRVRNGKNGGNGA